MTFLVPNGYCEVCGSQGALRCIRKLLQEKVLLCFSCLRREQQIFRDRIEDWFAAHQGKHDEVHLRKRIEAVLTWTWSIPEAANELGINHRTLEARLKKWGLKAPRGRATEPLPEAGEAS